MATVAQQPKTDRDSSAPDSQIPRLIIIGAALLVVLGGLGVWFLIAESSGPAEVATLKRALKALDQSKYAKARALAEEIRDARSALPDELGGIVYVLGASTADEASEKVQQERINYYMLAARYLEEARDRGFPQGRKASGLLLLGECLFNGHRYVQSRLVLKEALAAGAKPVSQIHLLLSTSHLKGQSPNFKNALAHNTSYLEDKSLTVTSRQDGLLQRSEIQFHLGQTDACRATLSAIPKRSKRAAHAIIMRGRILLHEAGQLKNAPASQQSPEHQLQASQRYDEAIKLLRTAMGRTTLGSDAKAQAMYLSGLCYLGKGEFQAAKKQLSKIRDLSIQTPEKLAAMLLEADLLRQHLGQDDAALENYRRARDVAGPPESYSNRWVSLSEFRRRLLGAYHEYLKIKNFHKAIDLSGLLYVEGSDRQAMSKTQRINGQLAESTKSTESAVTFFRDAIKQLSQAVARYPKDSRLNSARYMIAESHRQSAMLPKQKLENTEITTTRLGLIKSMNKDLRESIRHLVKVQTSLNERQETTPLSVHEKLLLRNTYFAQGIAQFDLGEYEEAIRTYSTATNRYLNDPVVLDAFVQIAHCYRKMNEPGKARGIMQQARVALDRIPPDAQFDRATPYTRDQWQQMIDWQINL
jgi:tetratricopeptide (TPR) repeat protein